MAIVIRMPRLSDTMQEGFIKTWNKKIGDSVKPGDILAEVETDKATMDLEAYQEGTLLHIAVHEGAVPVDGLIAIIGEKGENISELLKGSENPASIKPEVKIDASVSESKISDPVETKEFSRIKASPLAKSLAKEKGLKLETIKGTGENGRIVKRDLEIKEAASAAISASNNYAEKGDQVIVLSQMRKTIAKRLSESKFTAPHFYLNIEVNMDQCVIARNQLNEISNVKISYNDLIVKAVSIALRQNLAVNVSWMGDKMIFHNDIHLGVAVAIEDGLVVPVIRNADLKSITSIRTEINDKALRAKERKLSLEEMQGNTFTISNLGMFDIEHFTAIINPPDACILAVGSIQKKAAVKDDAIVIANLMKMTLSCDHRAVDGATGAKFLQSLKMILENPISMLL